LNWRARRVFAVSPSHPRCTIYARLTDADESEDAGTLNPLKARLSALLVDQQLLKVLLNALTGSLDASKSDEESTAVYQVLSILENLVDLNPEGVFGRDSVVSAGTAGTAGTASSLESDWVNILEYLAKNRLPTKRVEVDSNAQYASEILAIILQSAGGRLRKRFVEELGGVDVALRALAGYRTVPPETPEQIEYLENMFDVLCALLMEREAKEAFIAGEGVALMVLFLKGRTAARTAALKCLDFATTRYGKAAGVCVEKGLLGLLFAVFMGRSSVKRTAKGGKRRREREEAATREEEEVRCVSILSNLFAGLGAGSADVDLTQKRQRIVAKFLERDLEKLRKLVEVMVVFAGRVASEEARIGDAFEGEDEDDVKEEVLLAKMDAGLFNVQQCAIVLAELWSTENEFALRKGIVTMLHEVELTLKFLKMTLTDYADSLGDGDEEVEGTGGDAARRRVRRLISQLGTD